MSDYINEVRNHNNLARLQHLSQNPEERAIKSALLHKGANFTNLSDYAGSPKPTIGVTRTHTEKMKKNLINVMHQKEHL